MDPDRIEHEVFVAAPVARVWDVITQARHIAGWFGDSAEVDLRVGGRMVLGWKDYGTYQGVVDRLEPPHVFAYRCAHEEGTEPVPSNSTLVEFTLHPEGEGTRLRVAESGFSALDLPEDERRKRLADNIDGWRQEMGELREYAERAAP